jgi:hypothetical protein
MNFEIYIPVFQVKNLANDFTQIISTLQDNRIGTKPSFLF